jgi:hypothetical protein
VAVASGGNVQLAGQGVAMMTLNAGGSINLAASGPIALGDPYAGNIIINSILGGGDIAATAQGSIFVPSIVSTGGGIALATRGDIEVPILTAAHAIGTAAGGVTNIVTATSGGDMALSGVGTITFRTLTAGGNLSANSSAGFVLGIPDADNDGPPQFDNLADDGSAVAGGNVSFTGMGVGFANLTASGNVSVVSYGYAPPSHGQSYGPNLAASEPLLDAGLANLYLLQVGLTQQAPVNIPAILYGLSYTMFDLTHAQYNLTAPPKPGSDTDGAGPQINLGNLVTTLENDVAGLLTVQLPPNIAPKHWLGFPIATYAVTYPPIQSPGWQSLTTDNIGAGPLFAAANVHPGDLPVPPGGQYSWPNPDLWADLLTEEGGGPNALPGGINFNIITVGGNAILSSGDAIQGEGLSSGGVVNITTDTFTPDPHADHGHDIHIDYVITRQLMENGVTVKPYGHPH